jgi:peptidoglycan/xylan/chitin deacetylase (PgdA/CDA1 family)
MYVVKIPWWLRLLYPSLIWEMPVTAEKKIYLTFDDGPHQEATPFVLEQLKKYDAKATFFCIGKNVRKYPNIYQQIIAAGHAIGNHTNNHLNGWQVKNADYINNIQEAVEVIQSDLFRPPYGRIRKAVIRTLQSSENHLPSNIVMWTVLSGDFDINISKEKCLQNVIKHTGNGSIVVFHDSTKAWGHMSYALPQVLAYFTEQGYRFEKL